MEAQSSSSSVETHGEEMEGVETQPFVSQVSGDGTLVNQDEDFRNLVGGKFYCIAKHCIIEYVLMHHW